MLVEIGHNQKPHSISEIREAILYNRKRSAEAYDRDPNGYRVDRFYANYMVLQPKWRKKVVCYLRELRASGERVFYADICGRATAVEWGVDASYCFSLHASNITRMMHPKQDVLVDGDVFRMRDFYSFCAKMRNKGDRPAFVTFEPIVGLERYTPSEQKSRLHPRVTWQRLENNLRRLLEVVRPGGYVYIDRPFQLNHFDLIDWYRREELENYTSVRWMKAFCKGKKCSLEVDRDICGVKFLVHKWKERKPKKPPQ